jgi:hypothetical protein
MSDDPQQNDPLTGILAAALDETRGTRAGARLKARLYSALLRKQQESGPLRSLGETRVQGYGLCVFEDLWRRVTPPGNAQCINCCGPCHARALGERLEQAPIYWKNCPYVAFGRK